MNAVYQMGLVRPDKSARLERQFELLEGTCHHYYRTGIKKKSGVVRFRLAADDLPYRNKIDPVVLRQGNPLILIGPFLIINQIP